MKQTPPRPITEPAIAAYVKLVRTAESLHGEVSRGLVPEGLTASQFSMLKVLRIRGPLAQRDIAKYLLKTGGNITFVVDNLEKMGLVSRVRDTEDRRIVFVVLTQEGEKLFDRVYGPHLNRIRSVMAALGNDGAERLIALLELLQPTEEPLCVSDEDTDRPDPVHA